MEILVANLSGKVRRVTEGGRDYLVAPVTLIVPGVLNGSRGPLYYPPDEVAASAAAWNGIPLTVGHPADPITNAPLSASSPGVLDRQGIGHVRAPSCNGRLRAEAWIDLEQARRVDNRIVEALEAGQPVGVSTGLHTENEDAPAGAAHNGRPYSHVARSYRPDHLAVLVDQVGACSLSDGCGLLANATTQPVVNSLFDRFLSVCSQLATNAKGCFGSEEQRRFMWANHPDVAESWAHCEPTKEGGPHHMPDKPLENAGQGRHPKDGTYQGMPHTAARAGHAGLLEGEGEKRDEDKEGDSDADSSDDLAPATGNSAGAGFDSEEQQRAFFGRLAGGKLGSEKGSGVSGKSDRHEAVKAYTKGKHPSEMSAAEINKALDKVHEAGSKHVDDMIAAGRGHERPSDYLHKSKTDELSQRGQHISEAHAALRSEVELRAGPGIRRLPRGFGPLSNAAADDFDSWLTYNRDWPQGKRDKLDAEDFAGPGQSFPIATQADVDSAAKLIGKAADPEAVKARIKAIAGRKGLKLPEAWQDAPTGNFWSDAARSAALEARRATATAAGGDRNRSAAETAALGHDHAAAVSRNAGRNKDAVGSHLKAAGAHETAAAEKDRSGDKEGAALHVAAAKAHRVAAAKTPTRNTAGGDMTTANYSPDQSRDDHGRFGSGGGAEEVHGGGKTTSGVSGTRGRFTETTVTGVGHHADDERKRGRFTRRTRKFSGGGSETRTTYHDTGHTETTENTANQGGTMYGDTGSPHDASKAAAGASLMAEHGEARDSAVGAVDASGAGNAKKAASFHGKAAEAHEGAATDARRKGDEDTAAEHDNAAALHRKAASMHAAQVANQTRNGRAQPMTRDQAVTLLTTNCKCGEADKAALNALPESTLLALARNAKAEGSNADEEGSGSVQAGGEEDEDSDDGISGKVKIKEGGKMTGNLNNNQLNELSVALFGKPLTDVRGAVTNALRINDQAKLAIVRQLTTNQERAKELMAESLPQLEARLADARQYATNAVSRHDAEPSWLPLFAGAGGGSVENTAVDNAADDLLDLPVQNYGPIAAAK